MLMGLAAAEGVRAVTPLPRYRAWALGAVCGLLPDLDFGIRLITGEFAPIERSSLHSLLATAVLAVVVWLVAGRRWALVAGAGYASHLLADLLQDQSHSSVALLWPLQGRMEPILPLFPFVPIQGGGGVMGAALGLFQGESFPALLQSTTIAAGVFFGVLALTTWLRARSHRSCCAAQPATPRRSRER
jgi:membrane-bound metal-dependent hydrolase YbcI (DUF457 family)